MARAILTSLHSWPHTQIPPAHWLAHSSTAESYVVLYLLLTIGLAALSLWITYTVIWRAARRGLREFHYPGIKMKGLSAQSVPRDPADPSDWSLFDGR